MIINYVTNDSKKRLIFASGWQGPRVAEMQEKSILRSRDTDTSLSKGREN